MVSGSPKLDLTDRRSLMASLPKGGVGAEIGVAEGCFSQVLLEVCKPRLLYLIDPWLHSTDPALSEDSGNVTQECHDSKYAQVRERLGTKPEVRIMRAYSLLAAVTFENEFFDWVHLDGNHTQTKQDIEVWWPKIRPGGWMTGHDYTMVGDFITVKTAVDKFVENEGLKLFVTRGENDVFEKNYPTWVTQKPYFRREH